MEIKPLKINGIVSKFYTVDMKGNVYSRGKLMTKFTSWNGYERVKLSRDIPRGLYLVHRIVAETFIENPEDLPIVNHKNNNRQDNIVSNLEWTNNSENQKQRYTNGHKGTKRKTVYQIDLTTGEVIKDYETPLEAEEKTGVARQNISKVCRGLRKQAGGYGWKY